MPQGKGTYGSKVGRPPTKKHRDPGAVERGMKKESAERKKDAEFIKKHKLDGACGTCSPKGKIRGYK